MNLFKLEPIFTRTAKIINPKIVEILDAYVDKKNRGLVDYQISTGGKRFRPTLAILSCKLLGGKIKDVLYPAAGLEILHNYTLIIDDIIDESELRRKKKTCWAEFGKSIAQCISADYSAAIFEAANRSKERFKISELFAETIKKLVDGEILDILFERNGRQEEPYIAKNRYRSIDEKDYYEMVGKKTAILFQGSCEAGAICAGASKNQIADLKNYGFNLGIAFQVQDDILDIFGEEKYFGKKIGKDIMERKGGNIVTMLALKELPKSERKIILRIMAKEAICARDTEKIIKLINKTKSLQKAHQLGEKFIEKAKKNLACLPQNKYNLILKEIAEAVMERKK